MVLFNIPNKITKHKIIYFISIGDKRLVVILKPEYLT